jgi:hypothetical protein
MCHPSKLTLSKGARFELGKPKLLPPPNQFIHNAYPDFFEGIYIEFLKEEGKSLGGE